ncbi:MAG: hypothetical protein AAGG46_07995, partial [Planctomycetota bacterium]
AVYLSTIVVGSIAGGLLFDDLLGHHATTAASHSTHGHGWAATVCGVVLLGLFARHAVLDARERFLAWYSGAAESQSHVH